MTSEREDLTELGRYAFSRLRDRLAGLTDDEYAWEPAPGVATIAWRLGHIADLLSEERNAAWLGVPGRPRPGPVSDAAGALAALDAGFEVWTAALAAVPGRRWVTRSSRSAVRTPTRRSGPSCCTCSTS